MVILATATIPIEAYMVPLYIMVYKVHMLNTYAALIFPLTIMTFGVFFMRQVIISIPDELLEAARIDGAGEWWIYLRIILYLSKSGLMAIGVFAFSQAWANFMWPLVVVSSGDMYTTESGSPCTNAPSIPSTGRLRPARSSASCRCWWCSRCCDGTSCRASPRRA